MLDGLYIEKAGKPAAVISTDAFVQQCNAMAEAHGLKEYTFVEVFHPIATASPESLNNEANRIVNDILNLLISKS